MSTGLPSGDSATDPGGDLDGVDDDILIEDPDATCLDFTQCRIRNTANLQQLTRIESLSLRWNLIKKIDNMSSLASTLTELDLYDNQIATIENLEALVNLVSLDLSHNRIVKIEGLSTLVKLRHLYLVTNRIEEIENLDSLKRLELLELGDNRIREIKGLDSLTVLQHLHLGKNKITKLANLDSLVSLQTLAVSSNRITKLEGVSNLVNLEELLLAHNGLNKIENLDNNPKVNLLDLSGNLIETLDNLAGLKWLRDLWCSRNNISKWTEVDKLAANTELQTVYLEYNPIQTDHPTEYRRKLKLALPSLTQIDATSVR